MTRETAPSGERPFDAEQMAREIAIGLDRRGFDFDEEIKAYAAALQRLHDANEAEVRGLHGVIESCVALLRRIHDQLPNPPEYETLKLSINNQVREARAALKETSQ